KHPLGEKRNHPGSKLRQGFWMVFRFGVNNWGLYFRFGPLFLPKNIAYCAEGIAHTIPSTKPSVV
ncbi:hypothetical protein, partial [Streptococcus pneumoniae]